MSTDTHPDRFFAVTIADTVFYTAILAAPTQEGAHDTAWQLFESDQRDAVFTDRSETELTIEEIQQ